jgi:hypothetical protein
LLYKFLILGELGQSQSLNEVAAAFQGRFAPQSSNVPQVEGPVQRRLEDFCAELPSRHRVRTIDKVLMNPVSGETDGQKTFPAKPGGEHGNSQFAIGY